MPLDYPGSAPYTIVETGENKIDVQELRIEYDMKSTIENFRKSDLYKNARVWSEIIIKELSTGREYVKFFLDFANEYANKINDPIRPYTLKTWEEAYKLWSQQN